MTIVFFSNEDRIQKRYVQFADQKNLRYIKSSIQRSLGSCNARVPVNVYRIQSELELIVSFLLFADLDNHRQRDED